MIVVSGSLALDQIMAFPGKFADHILPEKAHVLSLSFLTESLKTNFGGTAGNISYSLGLFGEAPVLLALAGKDFSEYGRHLKKAGVDVSQMLITSDRTASFFVITDRADCQIGGFYPGAMSQARKLSLNKLNLKKKDLVIISPNNPGAMNKLVSEARKLDLKYVYDPAQQLPRLSKAAVTRGVKGAWVLVANDYEMEMIRKKTGLTRGKIKAQVPLVVTTLGDKGSVLEQGNRKIKVRAMVPKRLVDPTGAGDAYRAGIILGLKRNWGLRQMGRVATLAATYVLERHGSQGHRFTKLKFKLRFERHYKKKLVY